MTSNPPMSEATEIKSGELWTRLRKASARGHATGALVPLSTTYTIVEDRGVRFQLRLLESLQKKDALRAIQVASKEAPRPPRNPFLPFEPDLFVGDICPSHAVVLNKFKVIDHHMLLLTRDFQAQTDLLTYDDFRAIVMCLKQVNGLVFYNGGEAAGSSQPHKHIQMIPLPMTSDPGEPNVPIETLLTDRLGSSEVQEHLSLPFLHAFQSQQHTWSLALEQQISSWFQSYQQLLRATAVWTKSSPPSGPQPAPYNLLATRNWMMLVPRSKEFFQRISVNSLGFAGGLLVRTQEEFTSIQELGPFNLLREVGCPRKSESFMTF